MDSVKKRIFVSRKLAEESPILSVANDSFVHGQSLIEFKPLQFDRPEADWIFFYSRNAVKYFFEADNYELYPYSWATLSQGTADELSKYTLDIDFIGNGKPHEVAEQFVATLGPSEQTCYIRAQHSIDSVRTLIENSSDFSVPVYSNNPVQDLPTDDFDILIFTSPMNVNCWFDTYKYREQMIIAIGDTTANALNIKGVVKVLVAEEPSEKAISEILRNCL